MIAVDSGDSAYKTYIVYYMYIIYVGDLRSGHFCNLPIISKWAKINSVIFNLAQDYLSGIISYRTVVENSSTNLRCLPLPLMATKPISRIFCIGELRSGHFCDLPIISKWAKNQLRYI